jgi:peptide/nickel transport system substrate-binding protein
MMRGSTRRRAGLGALAIVLVVGLATGCPATGSDTATSDTAPKAGNSGVVENQEPAQPGGKLVYGLSAETNGWNPSASQWASSGLEVAHALFDTISAYDTDSKIQPFLAERFDHNDAYTQWTITLRPGITLHNGKPVTAALVKANQEYLKKSQLTGTAYKPVDSFSTDGDLKLVVNMTQPWVNYPYALATQIGVVADNDWLTSGDSAHPIGTGPFQLVSWTPDQSMVVKKNQNYWRTDASGTRLPYLDEVEFRPIGIDASRSASLLNSDIDIMQTNDAADIIRFSELGKKGDFQVFNETKGETSEVFVQLNGISPIFSDLDARKALAYATDKTAFIDTVAQGLFEPANGPFPPSSPWYTPAVKDAYPQYDPVKAQEYVDKVKAKHGGAFSFTFIGTTSPTIATAMQQLQQQWKAVGIDAQIAPVEQAPMIVQVLTGRYDAVLWQQFDSPHPLGDSIWWHPESSKPEGEFSLNFAHNKDEEIGKKLDDARTATDPAQELADYQAVQVQLANDVAYIWLYHTQLSVVASNKIVNVVSYTLPPNAQGETKKGLELQGGAHPLAQVWIKHS